MKFSLYVLIPAGIALAFFVMQYLTATEPSSGSMMTREQIASELNVEPFNDLVVLFEEHFPVRHKDHMRAVADVMNDRSLPQARKGQEVMVLNRDFTDRTRRDFADFVGQASEGRLLDIQRAAVVLLEAVRDDADLCARVALAGPGALDRTELARIDRAVIEQVLLAYFRAIVEARADPITRGEPDEADWQVFVEDWVATDPDGTTAITAFLDGDSDNADAFCDGAISFRRQLLQDGSPEGVRIMAEFSQAIAAR